MRIIILFTVAFLLLLMFPMDAGAYGNSWNYRKTIIINNSQNPNSLSDYQILVNVSYASGMKSDFSDLRFAWLNASSGSEAPISYFIENYSDSSFAEVWIKIPAIRARNYETTYVYYGNPSAASESSGTSTFDFFDDFSGTLLDADRWNVTGDVSVENGEVSLFDYTSWILSKKEFGEQIISEARSRRGGGIGMYLALLDYSQTKYIKIRGSNDIDPYSYDTNNGIILHVGSIAPIDNLYHVWRIERDGTDSVGFYQDGVLMSNATLDLPPGNLKAYFRGGEYSGTGYYTYVDWVRIRKYTDQEPAYSIEEESNTVGLKLNANVPELVDANKNFTINIGIADNSNNPITNFSSSNFKLFRDSEQTNFTDFRNFNNGTYSFNASSGNIIGNISFRIEAGGASAENFSYVSIKPKSNIIFIANNWEDIFSAGMTGKPVFTNYSETEKYYLNKIRPEQVFVFGSITTNYPTYRFKNIQAFLEIFYSNETVLAVSRREQAISAAPYARLKNYPILINPDKYVLKGFNNIVNLSEKTSNEITDIAINEFSKSGKNINTIIIANTYSETSALAGALAAKHDSIIIPMNFSSISYPETVYDFYNFNSANGALRIKGKVNSTIKKLSDNFFFSNSIDYKIGRIQLNLILLGNASEVPQPAIFDSGREMFFDDDSNYLLSDFPYSDTNSDGKADLISGRIVSPYQLMEMPKENKIVTAALYRNLETIFSSNGLIESQSTDAAFRTAGFETVRLIENRTNLSYYELTFGLGNITDFLKTLFREQSIAESLKLMGTIYGGYNELLEHNYYKMMGNLRIGFDGLTIRMIPDERLTKESLLGEMQNADGIFYYGKGGGSSWSLESFGSGKIYFSEFPPTASMVYDERTNSARLPDKTVFEKGATVFIGSSGIIHDVYSFMPNAKLAQGISKNRSIALSLEDSRYPLLSNQIRNLTAALQFNYQPERDLALKQFLEMVCYCDPEKKIDPDAQQDGTNPAINHSATFKSKIKIPINYVVSGDRIFFDAGQYLQEMGKPVIPLYSAETVLPNGSEIIGISFNYNSTIYENISADFVPADEHFSPPEAVHGIYPSQVFYNETFGLLDGRKTIRLIVAGMQYNNDTKEAIALDSAEATIEYSAPFEFVEFSVGNITDGNSQTFRMRTFAPQDLLLVIDIRSGNFSETVEENISSGYSEVIWTPPFSGDFAATAYALMGNNSAGPRYAYFSVDAPKTDFLAALVSFGTGGYEIIMKGFTEKIMFAFNGASAFIERVSPFSRFTETANASSVEKHISSAGFSFTVAQDSGKIIYKMKSDKGELIIEKNAGATKETCKGDCSGLYEQMNSKLGEMQEQQDYVIGVIGK